MLFVLVRQKKWEAGEQEVRKHQVTVVGASGVIVGEVKVKGSSKMTSKQEDRHKENELIVWVLTLLQQYILNL